MAAKKPLGLYAGDVESFTAGDFIDIAYGGTGATDASTARTNLGLAIGTNVQAWDTDLDAISALSTIGIAVRTAASTWATRSVTSVGTRLSVTNSTGSAGNIDVDLTAGVVTPGTYNSVAVNTYGQVISGTNSSSGAPGFNTTITLINNTGAATTICRALYSDTSGTFKLAQSNSSTTRKVTGLAADASTSSLAIGNVVTTGVLIATTAQWDAVSGQTGGLTTDSFYYLSGATAGAITSTVPTTGYQVRVGKAISTTQLRLSLDTVIIRLT